MIPAMRQAMAQGPTPTEQYGALGIEFRDVTFAGFDGYEVTASVYTRPGRTGTGPGIYYVHGGGMIFGDRHGGPSAFADLILEHGAVVVSVEYRLAPEHPDPAPVEDAYAGLVWTADHLDELGIDPDRFIIAGHSAGAGLSAGVTLLARDRKGPEVRAQMLMSPMLDDRDATASTRQYEDTGTVSRATSITAWTGLLGDRRGTQDVSIYAAPARATDLTGLPPAFIDCGSAETFRDEDVAYATALWAAGTQAELHVWAGGFHGFDGFAPDATVSQAAVAARATWLERTLHL
jgi:acetyl esterase/lipase